MDAHARTHGRHGHSYRGSDMNMRNTNTHPQNNISHPNSIGAGVNGGSSTVGAGANVTNASAGSTGGVGANAMFSLPDKQAGVLSSFMSSRAKNTVE